MSEDTKIGVGLAKNVFQLHTTTMMGELIFRKQLSRQNFLKFMANQPAAVIVMEASDSADHRA